MVESSTRNINIAQPKDPTRLKLIILGEPAVGKSSIIRKWVMDTFDTKYEATIGVDFFAKDMRGIVMCLWDLSGHPEFFEVRNEFYKDCHGILLVYDITSRRTFDSLDMWLREANRYGANNVYLAICGNKADLNNKRAIPRNEAESWADSRRFDYFEVSAASGQNVSDMFESIKGKLRA
ncbi:unnamed protein product [Blepharisma stoltei]|uniref:Ras family protein n=1 Tax=Blepharisma stoltei TaxID=1481888 RepID=A0AAU9K9V5_9CILI|nr:unnamed protein product [Blepharisma stoltei]